VSCLEHVEETVPRDLHRPLVIEAVVHAFECFKVVLT